MNILKELTLFVRLVGAVCLGVFVAAGSLFYIGVAKASLFGFDIWVPAVGGKSLVVLVFERLTRDLVPIGATVVAGTPLAAFSAEMVLAVVLAVVLIAPLVYCVLIIYLAPALALRERAVFFSTLFFGSILFLLGGTLGYFFVIPRMFALLAAYPVALGIPQYFFIGDFIATVLVMLIVCGTVFLLPLFMPILTHIGLVSSATWRSQWRLFVVASLIVTALLTNDGMGLTMLMLTVPLVFCYALGVGISMIVERFQKVPE